ncbi:type VI secretion system membrane subunit TssM [Pseudomonas wadenswilerensis]
MLPVTLVMIAGAIWWLGPHWTLAGRQPLESLSARVLATVLLLVIPLLGWALRLRRRTRQLEAERKQDDAVRDDPCLRYIDAQERDLDRNLALLQSHLKGRNALYQIPWYLVLGQENAGKTSFVHRANPGLPLGGEDKAGSGRLQEDPDRIHPIDWCISDQAVLIDPPGEIINQARVTQDKDVKGTAPNGLPELPFRLWHHFVAWLGRNRSRRPLNGVVLMVSLVDLLNQKPSERKALAAQLRARLMELSRELGTRPPLYVVLSKFDLLEGFETLFARLSTSAREDILGFSFTLDSVRDYDAWLEELKVRYDAFIDRLNDQTFHFMANAVDDAQYESLYSLSRQIPGLRPVLLDFLADVLGSDRFATPALPRGVFFSSVYQQGVLDNAFLNAAAQDYQLDKPINAMHPSGRALVYFAQQLFQRIIYPESGLAGDNPRVIHQKKHALALQCGLASLSCAVIIGGWYHYYTLNLDKAFSVMERSLAFSASAIDVQLDPTGRNLLQPLDQISDVVAVYGHYRDAWPVLANMGLYQGRAIGPKVDQAYLTLLSQRFLPALASGVMEALDGATIDDGSQLAALRVVRMIEERSNRRPPVVEDWMAAYWQSAFPGQDSTQRALMRHLDYAMKYVDTQLPLYQQRVAAAQQHLRQIPLPERVYMTLRHEVGASQRSPLDLRNEIGPAFDILYQNVQEEGSDNGRIDTLLTAKGYQRYFSRHGDALTELAMIDQWALGERSGIDYSETDKALLAERIRSIYSRAYVDTWRRNLNQLEVRDFSNIADAIGILDSVTGPAAPLRRLVETVRDNSALSTVAVTNSDLPPITEKVADLSAKAAEDPTQVPVIMEIARAFAPLTELLETRGERASYLDETMQAIGDVQDKVRTVHDSPDRGKAALALVVERFSLKGPDPIANLQRVAAGLPEPLSSQVAKLAEESSRVMLVEALRELEQRWDNDVHRFYRERLADRYPFNPASRQEVSLQDFTTFFGPQGRLQQFREKYLDLFIEDNLEALYSERLGGYLIRSDVQTRLASAERIRDAFFNSRGLLGVQFYIEPLGLAPSKRSSSLNIEGQLVTYNHGPTTSTALIWPNTLAPNNESRMTLVNAGGSSSGLVHRGPWSLYRLLSQARLNGATSTSVDLSFAAPDGSMRYRITTEKANNPFTQPLFKGFTLPQTLLQEGL